MFWDRLVNVLVIGFQMQSDRLAYNEYTTYVGIFMWMWLVDMRSFLNMFHPYPCPHTFFTSESSLHFLKSFKKFLMCLFVYFFDGLWPLEMIRVCHHQHQHSFLHLCSFVCLVFHFRHTPRSREESWKATVWSTSSVSEPESLRRLDSWLLSLIYKSEVYIIPYRRATWCIHRQQWEEEVTGVRQSTAQHWLTVKNPSSHHATITDQRFCTGSARAEQ